MMVTVQTARAEIAEENMKFIEELSDRYIDMFIKELKINNNTKWVPTTIRVELIEDIERNVLKSTEDAATFNIQALMIAADRLNKEKGVKAKVKFVKFFTNDPKLSFAKRLVCKVKINKPKNKN